MSAGTHEGKVAIVTGAARGIGAALARGLAARGAFVVATDLRPADEVCREIEAASGRCVSFTADVSTEEGVLNLREQVHEVCGPCEILVNNAGIEGGAPFAEMNYALWRHVIQTNLDSQFLMATAFAPDMIERGWGRIVNVSSTAIYGASAGLTPYMASKAGVLGLTSGLASDLGEHGITVNAVSPAFTRTPMVEEAIDRGFMPPNVDTLVMERQSLKRRATPEDLVGTVLFLTSDDAAFVTAKFVAADGGLSRVF
jgi:3-oxoacyl-[acyl-carrier protein] reductase